MSSAGPPRQPSALFSRHLSSSASDLDISTTNKGEFFDMTTDMNPNDLVDAKSRIDVEKGLRTLIAQVALVEAGVVDAADLSQPGLLTSLGVTSIDAFELIVIAEERFGLEFDDAELKPKLVDPVVRLVSAICEKLGIAA